MEKKEQNLKEIKNLANQTSIEEASMKPSDVEYYGSCGWGSCGTGSSGGGEDYTQIQGSGYKGSPTGCVVALQQRETALIHGKMQTKLLML